MSSSFSENLEHLGLGYGIAVAIGFPFLLAAFGLLFYHFYRSKTHPTTTSHLNLPRVLFVAEEEIEDGGDGDGNRVSGLDQAAIDSYPKFPHRRTKGDAAICSVCLSEYKEGEMLRMMPECCHKFHLTCIDAWLRINASCPVCRTSPLPTPTSTPLAEVVPLAQSVDGRSRR